MVALDTKAVRALVEAATLTLVVMTGARTQEAIAEDMFKRCGARHDNEKKRMGTIQALREVI